MVKKDIKVKGSKALILGFTFKEDCPDVRNTKVIDIVRELETYGVEVIIYDPWADPTEVKYQYGLTNSVTLPQNTFDAVLLGVAHNEFFQLDLAELRNPSSIVFDVKGVLSKKMVDARL
jgi:UDP-N-acetyl-D-galactosamine dehydrogenase